MAAAAAAGRRIGGFRSVIRSIPANRLPLSLPPPAAALKTLTTTSQFVSLPLLHQFRCFSSPSKDLTCSRVYSGSISSSNIVYLKSDDDFSQSLSNVQTNRLPAIFYFTAAWCGPCRMLSPILDDLSKKYPHVNIYKIDVDQKELETTLGKLEISSVPTLHLFHEGKKAKEIVGADAGLLKKLMDDYYNKQQ
ncbi:hypothetical protein ACHQM5_013947 [Ranunculus cassubicifolius]